MKESYKTSPKSAKRGRVSEKGEEKGEGRDKGKGREVMSLMVKDSICRQ